MKKHKPKPKVETPSAPDPAQAISMMGQKKFNAERKAQILSGVK